MTTDLHTVPVAGGEMAYARWGDGPTTVLALPGITSNHAAWGYVADELVADDDVTVLAPDLRGRGDSGQLPGPYGYAPQVEDLVALLDHEEVTDAVVVGHSGGGFIGVKLTRQHPDRVAGLCLVDGGLALPLPDDLDPEVVIQQVLGPAFERLSKSFESREAYREYWRSHPAFVGAWNQVVEAHYDHDIHEVDGAWCSKVSEEAVRADGHDSLSDEDVHAGLADLGVPTHFVWSPRGLMDADPLYPREVAEALLATAPEVEATWLEDCNHYTMTLTREGAEQVADAVRSVRARASAA